jgi:hypothetical protein
VNQKKHRAFERTVRERNDGSVSTETIIEMIGYFGSALVVVSMLMTSVIKLRVINLTGSAIFAVYALIIRSYPTALMNACLVAINGYNLARLLKAERRYDLIDGRADEPFLLYIVDHYKDDIRKYFPGFTMDRTDADAVYIVCAGAVPAGVLIGKKTAPDTMEIILDYSTPVYRDCSVGAYLYARLPAKGIRRLVYTKAEEGHRAYLQKMGFLAVDGVYIKEL